MAAKDGEEEGGFDGLRKSAYSFFSGIGAMLGDDAEDQNDESVSKTMSSQTRCVSDVGPDSDGDDETVDPADFIDENQVIVHQGFVWVLLRDRDPGLPESWQRKTTWLTTSGGLHHYSRRKQMPVGRDVRGATCKVVAIAGPFPFTFEMTTPSIGLLVVRPTTLAAATVEERDAWIEHLVAAANSGGRCDIPDEVVGRTSTLRGDVSRTASMTKRGICRSDARGGVLREPSMAGNGVRRRMSMLPAMNSGSTDEDGIKSISTRTSTSGGQEMMRRLRSRKSKKSGDSSPVTVGRSPTRREFSDSDGDDDESPGGLGDIVGAKGSQAFFAERKHTVIVLDWDDTIFPTTWVRQDCALDYSIPVEEQLEPCRRTDLILNLLERFADESEALLLWARSNAQVVIVTLAKRPWVEISSANFAPGMKTLIDRYDIPVIYAQEYVTAHDSIEYAKDEFKSSEQVCQFWTSVKSNAISTELDAIHRKSNASWKNIISLGDSNFERYGTMAAGEAYMQQATEDGALLKQGETAEGIAPDGSIRKLRTKTVKMLDEPTVEELTAQLTMLVRWLPFMVRQDSGFDIEIDSTDDDEALCELHKMITGADEDLSWSSLAGLALFEDDEDGEDEDDDN